MTQIGLRGTGSARPSEVENARRWGSRLVTAEEFRSINLNELIGNIAEDHLIYITIDADGLDPSVMPAVMGPAPGGVSYLDVANLIQALGRRGRVVGLDIVELAPSFDYANGLSAITAGRLVLHGMVAASRAFGARA
jgi:agmatinase